MKRHSNIAIVIVASFFVAQCVNYEITEPVFDDSIKGTYKVFRWVENGVFKPVLKFSKTLIHITKQESLPKYVTLEMDIVAGTGKAWARPSFDKEKKYWRGNFEIKKNPTNPVDQSALNDMKNCIFEHLLLVHWNKTEEEVIFLGKEQQQNVERKICEMFIEKSRK